MLSTEISVTTLSDCCCQGSTLHHDIIIFTNIWMKQSLVIDKTRKQKRRMLIIAFAKSWRNSEFCCDSTRVQQWIRDHIFATIGYAIRHFCTDQGRCVCSHYRKEAGESMAKRKQLISPTAGNVRCCSPFPEQRILASLLRNSFPGFDSHSRRCNKLHPPDWAKDRCRCSVPVLQVTRAMKPCFPNSKIWSKKRDELEIKIANSLRALLRQHKERFLELVNCRCWKA